MEEILKDSNIVAFEDPKVRDEVFGLVYGKGVISSVWPNSHYSFEVEYENGSFVPYTEEGYPAWNVGKDNFRTIFYKKDIDLYNLDFSPTEKVLSAKKIIKLREVKKLEIRCPSGIWQSIEKCPSSLVEEYLVENKFYLFRKKD
jgi:hypothetical protein